MKNVIVYGLIFASFGLLPLCSLGEEAAKPAAIPAAKPAAPKETTKPFRTGTVLSAQLTNVKIKVTGLSKHAPPPDIAESDIAYAVVTVKLDKDRSLTIYDYELADGLATYPCWAISFNGGDFDAGKWEYPKTTTEETFSLLFLVKRKRDFKKFVNYKIQSRIIQGKGVELSFFNWDDKAMAPLKSIPATGNLGVDQTPPPPPKPKAPPKPAAKPKDAKADKKAAPATKPAPKAAEKKEASK